MKAHERGLSLVIVLLLLAGIMLLAVTGLSGAVAAMSLADLEERSARAFEAAEAGVTRTLEGGRASPIATPPWPPAGPAVRVRTEIHDDPPWQVPAWPSGFSLGSGARGFVLQHGYVLAEGSAGRGTLVRIEQGFAVLAPAGSVTP